MADADLTAPAPDAPPPAVPMSGPGGWYYPEPTVPAAPEGSPVGRVFGAFRDAFNSSGPASGDVAPETADRLKQLTGFDTWSQPAQNLTRAVNNVLVRPTVYDLSLAWHAMTGTLSGSQAAVAQLGEELGQPRLGRDIAAIPEAFPTSEFRMGMPSRAVAEAQRAGELRALEPAGGAAEADLAATAGPAKAATIMEAVRSVEEQRAFIRGDVASQLRSAGISPEQAEDIAALEATHYIEWSRWFGGKLGSAEDLYRAEAAEILGPGMSSEQPGHPPTGVIEAGIDAERVVGMTERFAGYRPVITAFRTDDAPTILHEVGHEWLEQLLRFAKHEAAPADFKATAAQARDWLGMAPDKAQPTLSQHEKFARGFEQYLREGKAPSPEMASIFERFRQHLVAIYETIRDLGKPINEDIRQVFDRMLAEKPQREPVQGVSEAGPAENWWEVDPTYIEPAEAEAALAQLRQQRDKWLDDVPDHVHAALAAALDRLDHPEPAPTPPPAVAKAEPPAPPPAPQPTLKEMLQEIDQQRGRRRMLRLRAPELPAASTLASSGSSPLKMWGPPWRH